MDATPGPCVFCQRAQSQTFPVSAGDAACATCVQWLGQMLLHEDPRLRVVFPALSERDDDDDEPEPTVQRPDGSKVELRTLTAELKQDLTSEQRAKLAGMYVDMEMLREAVLEAAKVLASEEPAPEPIASALRVLFSHPVSAPDAVELLRPLLLPV